MPRVRRSQGLWRARQVADISDVVRQRADALMLSGESAVGAYPDKAVIVLRQVATRIEEWVRCARPGAAPSLCLSLPSSLRRSASQLLVWFASICDAFCRMRQLCLQLCCPAFMAKYSLPPAARWRAAPEISCFLNLSPGVARAGIRPVLRSSAHCMRVLSERKKGNTCDGLFAWPRAGRRSTGRSCCRS